MWTEFKNTINNRKGYIYSFFIIYFVFCLPACTSTKTHNSSNSTSSHLIYFGEKKSTLYTNADTIAFEQFLSLYTELLEFKKHPNFKRYGFAEGGPYYKWLRRAKIIDKQEHVDFFSHLGVAPGDIVVLANEYLNTGGRENEFTKNMRGFIDEAMTEYVDKE